MILSTVLIMSKIVGDDDDLFEEVKNERESLRIKEEEKLKEKVPASEILYQDNNALNKILVEKSKKIEIVELEEDEEDTLEDVFTKEKVIAQLKNLGIDKEMMGKASISRVEAEPLPECNISDLEEQDISNYIGGEEDNQNSYLFE